MFTLIFGAYTFPNISFVVDGLPLEMNVQENQVARYDGAIIPQPYLKPRVFSITGKIYESTQAAAITDLLAMQDGLLPTIQQFYYRSDRYINAYCKSITPKPVLGTDQATMDVDIVMEAQDPYFYAAGASVSNAFNFATGTNTFNVNGLGNVFSNPVITLIPPGATITNNLTILNNTTGQQMNWSGVVGKGQTISFDSTLLAVTYQNADGLSYFSGDFLTVAAGSNSFTVMAGQSTIVTVQHIDRYYN